MQAVRSTPARLHRLTVEEYHRMAEAGVLAPDARVELIEGELIDMAPIGSRHWAVVNRLSRRSMLAVGERAIVSTRSSLRLGTRSEPQPDLAVLEPRADYYAGVLPTGDDALLVIEVAETTAAYDRQVKAPLYARHGVPELWIIHLEASLVRFYRSPRGEAYGEVTTAETPGLVPIAALPDVTIDLGGVLV